MADATIAPEIVEFTVTGTSPGRSAWLWTRALLRKAQMGVVNSIIKVKVMMTNALSTTTAAAIAAGTQIGLATRAGWNTGTKVVAKGLGLVAKGALWVAKAASWVVDKVGKAFGWFIGLFNKDAGRKVQEANQRFTDWRLDKIEGAKARVETAVHLGHAAMTTKGVSTVGRITAGTLGLGTIANLATSGAVVAHASTVPYIGQFAGMAFGPAGLLITGAVAILGGLFSWFFKRNTVTDRLAEIQKEAYEKRVKEAVAEAEAAANGIAQANVDVAAALANGTLVINLTDNGKGGTKVSISGDPAVLAGLKTDPQAMADVAEAAFHADAKETVAALKRKPSKVPAKEPASA